MTNRQETQLEPVEREVLSERVKDRILTWILEGELEPGSRIVETRVARELGTVEAPIGIVRVSLPLLAVEQELASIRRAVILRAPTKVPFFEPRSRISIRSSSTAISAICRGISPRTPTSDAGGSSTPCSEAPTSSLSIHGATARHAKSKPTGFPYGPARTALSLSA